MGRIGQSVYALCVSTLAIILSLDDWEGLWGVCSTVLMAFDMLNLNGTRDGEANLSCLIEDVPG